MGFKITYAHNVKILKEICIRHYCETTLILILILYDIKIYSKKSAYISTYNQKHFEHLEEIVSRNIHFLRPWLVITCLKISYDASNDEANTCFI